jgi:hypothetical protein
MESIILGEITRAAKNVSGILRGNEEGSIINRVRPYIKSTPSAYNSATLSTSEFPTQVKTLKGKWGTDVKKEIEKIRELRKNERKPIITKHPDIHRRLEDRWSTVR